ncbi:MAG: Phosphate regulon transcriptional regulatory protein PhoB [Gammaproteobacteria bacterium]|nr:Phosphate regulon transcriptional regulatory protein PhoB [Gammaproteobacteria bacterium]
MGEGVSAACLIRMARTPKILVVDDEPAIREMISMNLSRSGFECVEAGNTDTARLEVARSSPDLILLDWMLPSESGADFARRLKNDPATREIPIIMLTARTAETDKVQGLNIGADDYMTKPFSSLELTARIKAVLRRTAQSIPIAPVEISGLRLDPDTHRVTISDQAVDLSPIEFRLLYYLMTHPERVFSRAQLIQQVWDNNTFVEERTVDVHIQRLRKALEPSSHDRLIQTVRGTGYRLSTKHDKTHDTGSSE